MASVGILGGTFNPPHIGHLACAEAALDQLRLDRLAFMPVCRPPHKELEADPGPEHRLAMCRATALADERLGACALEVKRGGPSFTVDTLRTLNETRPQDQLTFVAGGDMAASLPGWREPAEVLRRARFAVAEREGAGAARAHVRDALEGLDGGEDVVFFDMPRVDVSSSAIRAALARGAPVADLLPDAVARYIAEHGLYGCEGTA